MSFDQDPNEQANISGADLAIMIDELKAAKQTIVEQQARIDELGTALCAMVSSAKSQHCGSLIADIAINRPDDFSALFAHDVAKRKETLEEAEKRVASLNTPVGFTDRDRDYYDFAIDAAKSVIRRMAQEGE